MNILCEIINQPAKAAAYVRGSEKYPDIRGKVAFYPIGNAVLVRSEIMGLPKNPPRSGAYNIYKHLGHFFKSPYGYSLINAVQIHTAG